MPFDTKGMNKTILLEKAYNEDDKWLIFLLYKENVQIH